MRVAVLWPAMSGYVDACLRALVDQGDEVFLAFERAGDTAPFDDRRFSSHTEVMSWVGSADAEELRRRLDRFSPDVVLVSSWHMRPYRAQLRRLHGKAVRVLCMDNQWRATPRQWLGRLGSRAYLAPLYDVAFVPGERQAIYAGMLGFDEARIWRGLYVADQPAFDLGPRPFPDVAPSFVFTGRLVPDKAIDVLADAYLAYRGSSERPWPLVVHGAGPMAQLLHGLPGVQMEGFVQPADLPGALRRGTCLLLPSRFEPWGVIVHEAAAAGMALVCSSRVGAAVHLLQDGWNGHLVPPDRPDLLTARMLDVAGYAPRRLQSMSEASRLLSAQYTPQGWARNLAERTSRLAPDVITVR